MKIIITESQFKRLIENIILESDSKRKEFIDILNQENISYEINNDNKIIIGGKNIYSKLITYIPDNVVFNNDDYVYFPFLKGVGNNIIFNNKDNVWLTSIIWFNINSVNFTNNVGDVYFGKELFWMNEFPYQIYNIKGNFKMWNDKKDEWEIIK